MTERLPPQDRLAARLPRAASRRVMALLEEADRRDVELEVRVRIVRAKGGLLRVELSPPTEVYSVEV